MRRLPALLAPVALIAILAACTSGGAPGWTYAPAPSATAAASGGASGAPAASGSAAASALASAPASAPASTAPSTAPSGAGSAAPSGAAGTITVTAPVGAATGGFQPTTLSASANTAFTIHFDNQDTQAPHNVELKDANQAQVTLGGDTSFFQGPGQRDYQVPALAPGTYTYFCAVHPTTMTGTLTIQ